MKYCSGILAHGAVKYGNGLLQFERLLGRPITGTVDLVGGMESKLPTDNHRNGRDRYR